MRNERGFTLVELVAVLILTAVLAAVALPRLAGPSGYAARGAHDQVLATLRYARQSAIAMRRNVCVDAGTTLLAVTHAVGSGAGQACSASHRVRNPANGLPFGDSANALPSGSALAAGGSMLFDAAGRPYSAVGNALGAALSFQVVGYAGAVTVEPETGVVR